MDQATFERKKSFARSMRLNLTPAEKALRQLVKAKQLKTKFLSQRLVKGWIVDFYAPEYMLIVEVDGSVHLSPEHQEKDRIRDESLMRAGYNVLHFCNQQVLEDPESVLRKLKYVMRQIGKIKEIYH